MSVRRSFHLIDTHSWHQYRFCLSALFSACPTTPPACLLDPFQSQPLLVLRKGQLLTFKAEVEQIYHLSEHLPAGDREYQCVCVWVGGGGGVWGWSRAWRPAYLCVCTIICKYVQVYAYVVIVLFASHSLLLYPYLFHISVQNMEEKMFC